MTSKSNALINLGSLFIGLCIILALIILSDKPQTVVGSVAQSSEYKSTTTRSGVFPTLVAVKETPGTLGSVVITGAAAGVINFYDATTTDITKRTGNKATSTIILPTFPASAATGTYTFDISFYDGLIVETIGTMPTTTITYR